MRMLEIPNPTKITALMEGDSYGTRYRVEFADHPPVEVGGKAHLPLCYGFTCVDAQEMTGTQNKVLLASLIKRWKWIEETSPEMDGAPYGTYIPEAVPVVSEKEADEIFKSNDVPQFKEDARRLTE